MVYIVKWSSKSHPSILAIALALLWCSVILIGCIVAQDKAYSFPYRWFQGRRNRRIGHHAPYAINSPPITISNLTCSFFTQQLNHFDLPKNSSGTYLQRYCYYDGHVNTYDARNNSHQAPVFLYVGNESPIETYINHTGLMWELAPHFGALVVFIEHRYEGESLPDSRTTLPPIGRGCMAYSSSIQALADVAHFIQNTLFTSIIRPISPSSSTMKRRPVIAFGGSYGGMLAAWLRMKYPSMVTGAIAASAPIWGLPMAMTLTESNTSTVIDSAAQIVSHGLQQTYPPKVTYYNNDYSTDDTTETKNHCQHNLLSVWPLIKVLSHHDVGRKILEDKFRLCHALPNETIHSNPAQKLIDWAQSPWFDLAEGSYPYPSSYISYALTHKAEVKLPSWPLQAACWKNSSLYRDMDVLFIGNLHEVRYSISYGDSEIVLHVDWDSVNIQLPSRFDSVDELLLDKNILSTNNTISTLLTSVRDAVGVWYNATLLLKCFDIEAVAPNAEAFINDNRGIVSSRRISNHGSNATTICNEKMIEEGSWPSLNCNEEMNLILTYAQGLGNDVFWPPTLPRNIRKYSEMLNVVPKIEPCLDTSGIFGYPQQPPDPWSNWYDTIYGGRHIVNSASNIIFSNGRLDPWSTAGVFNIESSPDLQRDKVNSQKNYLAYNFVPGLTIQYLSRTMIAIVMDLGGHHTDLMYSNLLDPPCVQYARLFERQSIVTWIDDFWENEKNVQSRGG
jgi:hypothetical protein